MRGASHRIERKPGLGETSAIFTPPTLSASEETEAELGRGTLVTITGSFLSHMTAITHACSAVWKILSAFSGPLGC